MCEISDLCMVMDLIKKKKRNMESYEKSYAKVYKIYT